MRGKIRKGKGRRNRISNCANIMYLGRGGTVNLSLQKVLSFAHLMAVISKAR